jgi:predicted secreted Zn-dependent protease
MCESLVKKVESIEKDFLPYVTKETPIYYLVQESQDFSKQFLETIFYHLEKIQVVFKTSIVVSHPL